jgi:hypothetical protein
LAEVKTTRRSDRHLMQALALKEKTAGGASASRDSKAGRVPAMRAINPLWPTLAMRVQRKCACGGTCAACAQDNDSGGSAAGISHMPNSAAARLQRSCAANTAEPFYQSAANYCLDSTYSPVTHPTMNSCYRDVPQRTSSWSCPPGDQVCFDAQGNCHDSPDRASIVAARNADGTCAFLGPRHPCYLKHVAVDGVPGIVTELIPELWEGAKEHIPEIPRPSWPL